MADAEILMGEHHDGAGAAGQIGEQFGVARINDARQDAVLPC